MNHIELCKKDVCTGCKSCIQGCNKGAIEFVKDEDGFEVPLINRNLCVECGKCMKICPLITKLQSQNNERPLTLLAYSKDQSVVKKSSSGGIFSILANYILENNGWVFGATMETDTLKVYHIGISSKKDLYKLRGSKYVQSDVNTIYKQVKEKLVSGNWVLFSGTPCQVAGLYSFLNKKYDKLYTLDVVCHGIPSRDFFIKYLNKISVPFSLISYIDFKNLKIWDYDTILYLKNGKKKILHGCDDFFMRSFLHGEIFRESCYNCSFARLPRVADITLGDFWGINRFSHNLKSNKSGNSVVLINNNHGNELFNQISHQCHYEIISLEHALVYNHNIYESSKRPSQRDSIYIDVNNLSLKELCNKYNHNFTFRNYLGFLKRRLFDLIR